MSDTQILSILDALLPEEKAKLPENWRNILRAWHQSTHDDLTGIWNRKYFEECCAEKLRNEPGNYLMLCSDIAEFKLVNELFGREKASDLLRAEADIFKNWPDQDHILYGKLPDDRFALLLQKEYFPLDLLTMCTETLQRALGSPTYRIKVSYGIYAVTDPTESVASMCDKALIAMKSIHESLEQCVAFYRPEMLSQAIHDKELTGTFERALQNGEFQIYLQPQVAVDGSLLGAEALARWVRPDQTLTPPGEFIPLFERTGLIHRLDEAIWEQAARKLQDWRSRGLNYHISVNISAKDFFYIDICRHFTELTQRYNIPPAMLNLEITESTMTQDVPDLLRQLQKLQHAGFLIEIDDFGSGYSSLNMLKDICADILKIDMGFLRETENLQRSRIILHSILDLAHALHMPVITEGVETQEQVQALTEMGCDAFQGYYFSPPLPVAAFEEHYF